MMQNTRSSITRSGLVHRTRLILSAALIGLPILAFGQQKVGSDGHALDANNMVGSGGSNNYTPPNGSVSGNQILTGNVTNGFQFRGRNFKGLDLGVGYTDPTAFRGLLPGQMVDQFTRQSTGVPTNANPLSNSSRTPTAFYGTSNTAVVPNGFALQQQNGGYVPASSITAPPIQDTRIGSLLAVSTVPRADELLLPGPVDLTAESVYMASALFGTRKWQMNNTADNQDMFNANQSSNEFVPTGPVERARAQQARIQQYQTELNQNLDAGPTNSNGNNAGGGSTAIPSGILPRLGGDVNQSNSGGQSQAISAPGQPLGQVLNQGAQRVQSSNLAPIAGQVGTQQTNRQYLAPLNIPPAEQQSTQFAELRKRLDQYNKGHPLNDEQANREFIAEVQARRALGNGTGGVGRAPLKGVPITGQENQVPGSGGGAFSTGPVGTPSVIGNAPGTGAPRAPNSTALNPNPQPVNANPTRTDSGNDLRPAPLQVGNLEEGVKAQGLRTLIAQAEEQVKNQLYAKAIDTYDEGILVAPNNPLLMVGRAEAELGGGYYRQAEADLRSAFKTDQALLMGQFDIQKRLGDARLQKVVADLKTIANDNPTNITPVFLLAYIAYNTHHEDQASSWLDVAQKRSEGADDIIPLLKKYWTFSNPATQPAPLNK